MQIVDQKVYSLSMLITTLLGAIMQSVMSSSRMRKQVSKYVVPLIALDALAYTAVSVYSIDSATIRFLSISVLNGAVTVLISSVFMDLVNNKMKGKELTNYQSINDSCRLWGAGVGAALAMFTAVGIDLAIYIQCGTLCASCVMDNIFLNRLNKYYVE